MVDGSVVFFSFRKCQQQIGPEEDDVALADWTDEQQGPDRPMGELLPTY